MVLNLMSLFTLRQSSLTGKLKSTSSIPIALQKIPASVPIISHYLTENLSTPNGAIYVFQALMRAGAFLLA